MLNQGNTHHLFSPKVVLVCNVFYVFMSSSHHFGLNKYITQKKDSMNRNSSKTTRREKQQRQRNSFSSSWIDLMCILKSYSDCCSLFSQHFFVLSLTNCLAKGWKCKPLKGHIRGWKNKLWGLFEPVRIGQSKNSKHKGTNSFVCLFGWKFKRTVFERTTLSHIPANNFEENRIKIWPSNTIFKLIKLMILRIPIWLEMIDIYSSSLIIT